MRVSYSLFEVLSHIWARLGRRVVVERLRHSLLAPGFLHTGRGGSKPPASPGWRPLPSSKAFGLQQPTGYHLFTIHSYLLPSPTQVGDAVRVRKLTYRYRVGSGIVSGTVLPAPGFLHTGRGGSKPPGSPGWRPLPSSKAFGLQQPTGYHLFTIHSYLLPSPTQVGDAVRVREPMYWYRVGSVSVCGTALPSPGFYHVSSRAG